jgi:uncharacterized protein YjiS (DUF1127 family)
MNTAVTKAELDRLLPEPRSFEAEQAHGEFQAALRARDALLFTGLPQLIGRLAERARVRRAAAELRALTDRELADIGLTRGDIGNVVAGTLRRAG